MREAIRRLPLLPLGACVIAFASGQPAIGTERVQVFASRILLRPDSTLEIQEHIRVRVERRTIRHGIFRDIPLAGQDAFGAAIAPFEVLSVSRDGREEPFTVSRLSDTVRIKIGNPGKLLERRIHVYEIAYETGLRVHFGGERDELIWNVTGSGWTIPIDRVIATITLPSEIPRETVRLGAVTGPADAEIRTLPSPLLPGGSARFEATRTVSPGSGFQIAASWPGGFIERQRPSVAEIGRAHPAAVRLAVTCGLVLGLFFLVWIMRGRDPHVTPRPTTVPPAEIGPAAARFLRRKRFDPRCLTAAFVSLASKGWLAIERGAYSWQLHLQELRREDPALPPEEWALVGLLRARPCFGKLQTHNATRLDKLTQAFRLELESLYENTAFRTNRAAMVLAVLLSIAGCVWAALEDSGTARLLFLLTPFSSLICIPASFALSVRTRQLAAARRELLSKPKRPIVTRSSSAILAVAATVPLLLLAANGRIIEAGPLAVLTAIHLAFYPILPGTTRAGRRLLAVVEGFREHIQGVLRGEVPRNRTDPSLDQMDEAHWTPWLIAFELEDVWDSSLRGLAARENREDGNARRNRFEWLHEEFVAPLDGLSPLSLQLTAVVLASSLAATSYGHSSWSDGGVASAWFVGYGHADTGWGGGGGGDGGGGGGGSGSGGGGGGGGEGW